MRVIKFRGKTVKTEQWIFGDLDTQSTPSPRIMFNNSVDNCIYGIEVISETVGQFTDIKDGKGTEIYKDDIIEVTLRHNKETVSTYIAVVDQKEGAFGFKNKQGFCPFYGQIHENYRVIGNIHDNPELMKGGE